jgi:phospholipid N-methyltransferase
VSCNLGRDNKMKRYEGFVDSITEFEIRGWAADMNSLEEDVFVDIRINGKLIATIRANLPRPDLVNYCTGNYCKGFFFDPKMYLEYPINQIEVLFSNTNQKLNGGEGMLCGILRIPRMPKDVLQDEKIKQRLLNYSQQRWKGDEVDEGLTWGKLMSGESFISAMSKFYVINTGDSVLEIGPGYGRLIKTILEKQLPFSKYDGLELSSERVKRLRREFTDPRINFIQGDVMKFTHNAQYNLVLCSATFEHLFPDFSIALSNIVRHLVKNAYLFIDFIMEDDNLSIEFADFEKMGDAFVRIYSKNELERLFVEQGIRIVSIEPIILGRGAHGRDVRRALVVSNRNLD